MSEQASAVSSFSSSLISSFTSFFKDRFVQPIEATGKFYLFSVKAISSIFSKPFRRAEIIQHLEFVGNQSIGIILLTGAFTGLALSFQIWIGFSLLGASDLVGPTVALAITREIGPVLTGLVIAARAGGAMAAQLGTMRVSEQIDALEVMGVSPIQYLVGPRVLAAVLATPLLCALFDFIAMAASYMLSVHFLGLDEGVYWERIRLWVDPSYVYEGLVKTAIFGLFFGLFCTFRGFTASGGARGVGEATNRGVVVSMVMVIILDYFVSNFIRFYYIIT